MRRTQPRDTSLGHGTGSRRHARRAIGACSLLLLIVAAVTPALAADPDGQTITEKGNGSGAPPCQSCHGKDGGGQAQAGYPRLAGLNAAYLHKQLDDYASGERENGVMKPVASALSKDERKAVAQYYSNLSVPTADNDQSAEDNTAGEALATRGDWDDEVPACESCHGPGGVGVGEHFPPLAGQSANYIRSQLQAWQSGDRHNDPQGLMMHVAKALDDDDIDAVAEWFAAQPAKGDGGDQ